MTHAELDTTYTALAEAVARRANARTTVAGDAGTITLAEQPGAAPALAQIAQAERLRIYEPAADNRCAGRDASGAPAPSLTAHFMAPTRACTSRPT